MKAGLGNGNTVEIIRKKFNKTTLRWEIDGVKVTNEKGVYAYCDKFKSQKENLEECMKLLKEGK